MKMKIDDMAFLTLNCKKHGLQKTVSLFGGKVVCEECYKEYNKTKVLEIKDKVIFDIGNIIHVRYKNHGISFWKKSVLLTPEEIINSEEYKYFKGHHPEICKIAEGDK